MFINNNNTNNNNNNDNNDDLSNNNNNNNDNEISEIIDNNENNERKLEPEIIYEIWSTLIQLLINQDGDDVIKINENNLIENLLKKNFFNNDNVNVRKYIEYAIDDGLLCKQSKMITNSNTTTNNNIMNGNNDNHKDDDDDDDYVISLPTKLNSSLHDWYCFECHHINNNDDDDDSIDNDNRLIKCKNCWRCYHQFKCIENFINYINEIIPKNEKLNFIDYDNNYQFILSNNKKIIEKIICPICILNKKYKTLMIGSRNFNRNEFNQILSYTYTRFKAKATQTIIYNLNNIETILLNNDLTINFNNKDQIQNGDQASDNNQIKNLLQKLIIKYLIYKTITLNDIENKLMENQYNMIGEFLGDCLTIKHMLELFNFIQISKDNNQNQQQQQKKRIHDTLIRMLEATRYELKEMIGCIDCYRNSNAQNNKLWFCQPCRPPHLLVFAKQKGYPYWPAKVIYPRRKSEIDNCNQLDVRFFGSNHERSIIDKSNIKDINSSLIELNIIKPISSLDKALQELRTYRELLENNNNDNDNELSMCNDTIKNNKSKSKIINNHHDDHNDDEDNDSENLMTEESSDIDDDDDDDDINDDDFKLDKDAAGNDIENEKEDDDNDDDAGDETDIETTTTTNNNNSDIENKMNNSTASKTKTKRKCPTSNNKQLNDKKSKMKKLKTKQQQQQISKISTTTTTLSSNRIRRQKVIYSPNYNESFQMNNNHNASRSNNNNNEKRGVKRKLFYNNNNNDDDDYQTPVVCKKNKLNQRSSIVKKSSKTKIEKTKLKNEKSTPTPKTTSSLINNKKLKLQTSTPSLINKKLNNKLLSPSSSEQQQKQYSLKYTKKQQQIEYERQLIKERRRKLLMNENEQPKPIPPMVAIKSIPSKIENVNGNTMTSTSILNKILNGGDYNINKNNDSSIKNEIKMEIIENNNNNKDDSTRQQQKLMSDNLNSEGESDEDHHHLNNNNNNEQQRVEDNEIKKDNNDDLIMIKQEQQQINNNGIYNNNNDNYDDDDEEPYLYDDEQLEDHINYYLEYEKEKANRLLIEQQQQQKFLQFQQFQQFQQQRLYNQQQHDNKLMNGNTTNNDNESLAYAEPKKKYIDFTNSPIYIPTKKNQNLINSYLYHMENINNSNKDKDKDNKTSTSSSSTIFANYKDYLAQLILNNNDDQEQKNNESPSNKTNLPTQKKRGRPSKIILDNNDQQLLSSSSTMEYTQKARGILEKNYLQDSACNRNCLMNNIKVFKKFREFIEQQNKNEIIKLKKELDEEKQQNHRLTNKINELEIMLKQERDLNKRFDPSILKEMEEKFKREISEIKHKQWCTLCEAEANYFCCFKTNYCSRECQIKHWQSGRHQFTCTRNNKNLNNNINKNNKQQQKQKILNNSENNSVKS